jgi:hypothetical protein
MGVGESGGRSHEGGEAAERGFLVRSAEHAMNLA